MADSVVMKFGHDPEVMVANLMFFGIKQVVMVYCKTLEFSKDIGAYSKYVYGYLLVWHESLREDDQLRECKKQAQFLTAIRVAKKEISVDDERYIYSGEVDE